MPCATWHSARTAHVPWHESRQAGDAGPAHRAYRKVTRFHIEAEERALNNILRGFSKLIVTSNRRSATAERLLSTDCVDKDAK